MKKILLIIALLISVLGLNAQSVTIGDLKFTVTSETPAECEVSGYSGEPTDVTIPSTVTISGKEYTVTSIESQAFSNCSSLTSIDFGENSQLASIEEHAFYRCSSLTSIDFGENSQLASIGEMAFYGCSSLTSIEIPSGVTSIEGYAFKGCSSLTSIGIPSGVTSIGDYAFQYCESLTSIVVESGNTVYDSRDNCNAIIETATNTLIVGCQNTVIPNTVTSIGEYAFSWCSSLTSIEFEENSQLTSIGDYAFYYCSSLTSIEIPSGVTSIGLATFAECSSLTSIEIPSGVTSIGDEAFDGCSSLTSIDFGENSQLASIEEHAFSWCSSLTSIEIPSGVTSIGDWAFYNCSSLTSIEIPSGVTSIGNTAFSYCDNLTSIEIPSGVTSIGHEAFRRCSSLTSIDFGENSQLTSIGSWAFYNCSSLTSIELPSGVTEIDNDAFNNCSSLTSIVVESGNTVYDSRDNCNAIIETATNTLIAGCKNTVIPNSVTSIGDEAFAECSSLTSIEIPSGVTYIGDGAFFECSSLTSIELPNGVTSIGNRAFGNCFSLTSIYCYAESVPETDSYAFDDCPSDMVIYVPEQSVGAYKAARPWREYTILAMPNYEIAVVIAPSESGVVNGAGTYNHGEEVTLTATFNEGYRFINWTENGEVASEEAEYSFVIIKDRNLVAKFELLSYNVTASVNPENAGVVTGAGTYNHGEEVALTATANEGYKFVNWTENGEVVSEEAEYSFEITKDRNLVANFELLSYNVTALVNPENAGVVNGAGTYNHGEEVALTATANEGYKFVNWTENGEVVSEDAEYSFVIENDRNLVANFEKKEVVVTVTYNVTTTVNPEKVGVVIGSGVYNEGDNVVLTAIPIKNGYEFVNWTENGEVVSEEAQYSFVVESDRNLVANFEKKEVTSVVYNITTTVNPENVGVVIGSGVYYEGDNVILTAIPIKNGYEFVNWTEDGKVVSEDAQYSFVATLDRELVANFVLLEYYVTAALSSAEAGEITGDGNYNHGEEVILTATANAGYTFVNWTENGVVVSEEAEYSFVILKDRNLVANFISEDIPFNVVATAIDDNTIKIEWNAIESAESYNVYRASVTRNSEYEFIANVKETSFTDTGLDANTKYFYSVTAVYADGSESEKSESAEATTKPESIEELNLSFNIYPNPVSDKLYIETEVEVEEVSIFDIYGRRQELSAVSCQPSAIDVSNLNSGVYFVKVVTSEGEVVKRILKF